ncbi:MAG: nuclear transport factor 2 family protein [Actinomycetota bacterium]|nr:nuclear transport factor 2 family protein [Actinomycetota bacterium]
MGEHRNVEVLRRAYAAFATGDLEALDDLFADDVIWHVPGRSPVAGDHEGKEEVLGALTKLMDLTDGTARLEARALMADDVRGIALVDSTANRHDGTHTSSLVQVFSITEAQITEVWSYPGDPYGDDLFLSS